MASASIPRLSPPRWRQLHVVALLLLLLALAPPNYCGATDANPQQPKEHFIPGQEAAKLQGKLFHCAWQFETSHARCNMGVIDKTARYAGWTLFPNHRVYKLRGRYPTEGIYYAVTIYDTSGVHIIGGLPDFAIAPKRGTGANPYRDLGACEGPEGVGEYEMHIVTDGRSRGLPNEMVLDLFANMTAIPIVILREYGLSDPSQPCHTLPQASYLGQDGQSWNDIPTCDEDARIRAGNARCRAITNVSPPVDPNTMDVRFFRRLGCQTGALSPSDGIWPHFALKSEDAISQILGFPPVYTNAFSEYMYWCVSQHYLNMTSPADAPFIRIKGRLPRVASGLFQGPARAANLDSYDIRYLSFTLADLWWPGNVFTTVSGLDIERFYTARQGHAWDRQYSLVLTYDLAFPAAHAGGGFDPDKEMLLVWGGDPEHPRGAVNPIVVFREILPASVQREFARRPYASYFELNAATAATGMFGGTMVKAHRECALSPKAVMCHSPQYLQDCLETGYYPQLEVWKGGVRIK